MSKNRQRPLVRVGFLSLQAKNDLACEGEECALLVTCPGASGLSLGSPELFCS